MSHALRLKRRAAALRRKGESIPAIARTLDIAKSTISLWVREVPLPERIAKQLRSNSMSGREKGRAVQQARRKIQRDEITKKVRMDLANMAGNKAFWRLTAALLFWCEGSKRYLNDLRFTNSDPNLICMFLFALRKGFAVDEKRFRILPHLHEYHVEKAQQEFWSNITKIPLDQFTKTYWKPHTAARKRDGYQGCISLRYNDATIAKTLDILYHTFATKYLGM